MLKGAGTGVDIEVYVRELVRLCPGISAIWLIGSRANGTARPTSDYDLVVFTDRGLFESMRTHGSVRNQEIDLFIVFGSNGDFETPWGEKKGNLKDWEWSQESPGTANYRSVKFMPDKPGSKTGVIKTERLKAKKLYPADKP